MAALRTHKLDREFTSILDELVAHKGKGARPRGRACGDGDTRLGCTTSTESQADALREDSASRPGRSSLVARPRKIVTLIMSDVADATMFMGFVGTQACTASHPVTNDRGFRMLRGQARRATIGQSIYWQCGS